MSQQVYTETENYTIRWDDDVDAAIHEWYTFTSGEAFREGCEDLLEFIEERNATKMLVDTREMKGMDQDDQAWMLEDWIPRVTDSGLKASVTVLPDSAIAEMTVEKIVERAENFTDDPEYEATLVSDLDDAREWLDQR